MSDDEGIHGLGPVAACVICNGRAQREAAEEAERPRMFPAKFEGQCDECNLPIAIGQIVAWLPERKATHEECWPSIRPVTAPLDDPDWDHGHNPTDIADAEWDYRSRTYER